MSTVIDQLEIELDSAEDVAEQVRLLNLISEEYQQTDPQQALAVARRGVAVAVREKHRPGIAESYRNTGLGHFYSGNYSSARIFLDRALRLYRELGDIRGEIRSLSNISTTCIQMLDYRRAHEVLRNALELTERCNDPGYTALVLSNLGSLYAYIGDYPQSLDFYYRSLRAKEEAELPNSAIANDLLNIGTIHYTMQNYEKALPLFTRALEIRKESGALYGQVIALSNLGLTYSDLGDYDTGFVYDAEAAAIAEGLGNPWMNGSTLSRVGWHYRQKNEYERAEECFQKTIEIGTEAHLDWVVMTGQSELAKLRILTEEYDEAIDLLHRSLLLAEEGEDHEGMIEAHRLLSEIYEKLGNAAQGFYHYKRHVELKEQLMSQEKQNAVAEIQLRMEIETADKEREIFRLKSERLELEMDHKAKELTSLAMQLVQKNEFLDAVATRIKSLRNSDEGKQGLDALLREVDGNRNNEGEWDQFEQQFRSIHYDFTDRLARDYPSLSPTELKVCSLLKINLATKEIANILCCSPRTVEDHRYRIRTKLGITSAKNLSSYLAGM